MEDASDFINHIPDSLKFETDGGRTVYGGGGIVPDYIIPADTSTSAYVFNFAIRNQASFDYVRTFLDENGDAFRAEWESDFETFRENFEWDDSNVEGLRSLLVERGMFISDTVKTPDFRNDTLFVPKGHFEDIAWLLKGRMKAEVARQVWGMEYFYPIVNDVFDTTLKKAMTLWDAVAKLEELASGNAKASAIGNLSETDNNE
jgi:carboxyl-terminal processing protease